MSVRGAGNRRGKSSHDEKPEVDLSGLSPEEVLADLLRVKPTSDMPRGAAKKPYTKSRAAPTGQPRRGQRRPKGEG